MLTVYNPKRLTHLCSFLGDDVRRRYWRNPEIKHLRGMEKLSEEISGKFPKRDWMI